MKFLITILSALIIALSVSPCCAEEGDSEEIVEAPCDNPQSGENHEDGSTCSPFYSCGACHGFTPKYMVVEFTLYDHQNTSFNTFYILGYSNGFVHLPLKPPRAA